MAAAPRGPVDGAGNSGPSLDPVRSRLGVREASTGGPRKSRHHPGEDHRGLEDNIRLSTHLIVRESTGKPLPAEALASRFARCSALGQGTDQNE
jgi:hypothetical protein